MLDLGFIRPSFSSWSSALHMVPKKVGDWRPCGDYRKLREIPVAERSYIPNLQDFAGAMHGFTILSKVDLI